MVLAFRPEHSRDDLFTLDDLFEIPHDGHRYELIDGMLIVSPLPHKDHALASSRVLRLLFGTAPEDVEVLGGDAGFAIGENSWLVPDAIVVPRSDFDDCGEYLVRPPLLVVEVISPSSRRYDRTVKFSSYDEAGVHAYWIVDPTGDVPTIQVFERSEPEGRLVLVSSAEGEEVAQATVPWPVEVCPAALLR